MRTEKVEVNKFKDVGVEIANAEGEDDLSLESWRRAHREFFSPYLADLGIQILEEALVVTEFFSLAYR